MLLLMLVSQAELLPLRLHTSSAPITETQQPVRILLQFFSVSCLKLLCIWRDQACIPMRARSSSLVRLFRVSKWKIKISIRTRILGMVFVHSAAEEILAGLSFLHLDFSFWSKVPSVKKSRQHFLRLPILFYDSTTTSWRPCRLYDIIAYCLFGVFASSLQHLRFFLGIYSFISLFSGEEGTRIITISSH